MMLFFIYTITTWNFYRAHLYAKKYIMNFRFICIYFQVLSKNKNITKQKKYICDNISQQVFKLKTSLVTLLKLYNYRWMEICTLEE